MTRGGEARKVAITPAQGRYFSWMSDVLLYTVVLNLFVEYVDAVIIDSFTISILTAVLLKVLLDVVLGVEGKVHHFFDEKEGPGWSVVGTASIFVVLFLGKLFILEMVNLVFGDHVELGHFIEVVALILALMIVREIFKRIYLALGGSDAAPIVEPKE